MEQRDLALVLQQLGEQAGGAPQRRLMAVERARKDGERLGDRALRHRRPRRREQRDEDAHGLVFGGQRRERGARVRALEDERAVGGSHLADLHRAVAAEGTERFGFGREPIARARDLEKHARAHRVRPMPGRCALTPSDGPASSRRATSIRSALSAGSSHRSSKSPTIQHGPSTPSTLTSTKPAASSSAPDRRADGNTPS
jgi:hypothetical protein